MGGAPYSDVATTDAGDAMIATPLGSAAVTGHGSAPPWMSITPNPSRGPVRIAWAPSTGAGHLLEVLDLQGRCIASLRGSPTGASLVAW